MKLSGHTILITGGGRGIGFELTKSLVALGNTVLITGRDAKTLEAAKKQLPQIHTFQSDVSDSKSIDLLYDQVISAFPSLNFLINNAGIMRTINVHEKSDSIMDMTREINTNLSGPIQMVTKFLPHLKKKEVATIVNVTSGLAFVPLPMSPVYCATKAGLHSYTLSLRVQLKKSNIKVFELAPPATKTDLLGDFMSEDMKGISIMAVEEMVAVAIAGFQNDQFEIRPGQSNQLKFMSRLAPQFILNQMSKPVDRMLSNLKN